MSRRGRLERFAPNIFGIVQTPQHNGIKEAFGNIEQISKPRLVNDKMAIYSGDDAHLAYITLRAWALSAWFL